MLLPYILKKETSPTLGISPVSVTNCEVFTHSFISQSFFVFIFKKTRKKIFRRYGWSVPFLSCRNHRILENQNTQRELFDNGIFV